MKNYEKGNSKKCVKQKRNVKGPERSRIVRWEGATQSSMAWPLGNPRQPGSPGSWKLSYLQLDPFNCLYFLWACVPQWDSKYFGCKLVLPKIRHQVSWQVLSCVYFTKQRPFNMLYHQLSQDCKATFAFPLQGFFQIRSQLIRKTKKVNPRRIKRFKRLLKGFSSRSPDSANQENNQVENQVQVCHFSNLEKSDYWEQAATVKWRWRALSMPKSEQRGGLYRLQWSV